MATIKHEVIVPYSAAEMYALVNNVAEYSQFLPGCKSSYVIGESDDEMKATLVLAKGGLQKAFTTHNRLQKNKMIEVRLVNGPFRHLEGFWQFEPLTETSCRIIFNLEFEFATKLISLAIGPIFHPLINRLVDAFQKRAEEVYGKRTFSN